MNETQKLILLATALVGMNISEIETTLTPSELAFLQYKIAKLTEDLGEEAEQKLTQTLQEATQQLYNDIFES
ncbi:hypothetical protein MKX47_12315 [Solibacillus sp. FSL R7-0668]|uniref:hypothetical protein n=1 Tax=Solibacillus sp. FSL R7-0668 TaxID=2921688 RepID=UPI0030F88876